MVEKQNSDDGGGDELRFDFGSSPLAGNMRNIHHTRGDQGGAISGYSESCGGDHVQLTITQDRRKLPNTATRKDKEVLIQIPPICHVPIET